MCGLLLLWMFVLFPVRCWACFLVSGSMEHIPANIDAAVECALGWQLGTIPHSDRTLPYGTQGRVDQDFPSARSMAS